MQGVVRAHLHAFAAADATRQKLLLVQGRRGPDQPLVRFGAEAGIGAQQGKRGGAGREASQHLTPLEIRALDGTGARSRRKEAELNPTLRAIGDAVHAQNAFGFTPRRTGNGIVPALAMKQATVAIFAFGRVFLQAQNGPARSQSQQRSQRAQRAAP